MSEKKRAIYKLYRNGQYVGVFLASSRCPGIANPQYEAVLDGRANSEEEEESNSPISE